MNRRLLGLVARDSLPQTAVWVAVITLLCTATPSSYQDSFATDAARQLAVAQAGDNPATLLLYGTLSAPGQAAQVFTWEIGSYATILAAIAGVLLATRLFSAWEADGRLEQVRTCGTRHSDMLAVGAAWLLAVAGFLVSVVTLAVGSQTSVDGITWPGAIALGGVIGVTFLVSAAITAVCAQLVAGPSACHVIASGCVAMAFLARAWADTQHHPWASTVSVLGLREQVEPFAANHTACLAWWSGLALALFATAVAAQHRRDAGVGLFPSPTGTHRRLHVTTLTALHGRLAVRSISAWMLSTGIFAALMTGMGRGAVAQARAGTLHRGVLASQLGGAEPAVAYIHYQGTLLASLLSVFGLLLAHRAVTEEQAGLADGQLATGRAHPQPLAAHLLVSLGATLLVGLTTTVVVRVVAARELGDPAGLDSGCWRYVLGQWPAIAFITSIGILLAGAAPRRSWLAWLAWGAATAISFLGPTLQAPGWLMLLSPYQHTPDAWSAGGLKAPAVLLAMCLATLTGALVALAHRDIKSS